jgi:membrane-associated phospholipid phosphatase
MSFVDTFVIGLIFLAGRNVTYAQNSQVVDSGNSLKIRSNGINYTKISAPQKLGNYYITDSIFSFRSPKGYFPSLLHNFGEQATAPLHFKTKQWLMTGAVVGITAALVHFDNDIDDWARFQKQNHNWVNKTSPFITSFGSNTGILSVIGFGSISAVFKNEKGVQTSLLATQAMITSGVWVRLIKILSGRERPSAAYDFSKSEGGKWYGPLAQFDQDLASRKPGSSFDSFVSGHTATAFSIATVFALQYRDIKAVPIISYTAASLVGISRLTEHAHWASDVFGGALLGYLCGKQVVSHYNKTHQNSHTFMQSKIKTELTFFQYGNQVGFSLNW